MKKIFLAIILLFPVLVNAATGCVFLMTGNGVANNSPFFSEFGDACLLAGGQVYPLNGAVMCASPGAPLDPWNTPLLAYRIQVTVWEDDQGNGYPSEASCLAFVPPPPIDCSTENGVTKSFDGGSGGAPSSVCSSECNFNASGVSITLANGSWLGNFTGDGQTCSGSDQPPSTDQAEKCQVSGGDELCGSTPPPEDPTQDCGTLNDNKFCTTTDQNCGKVGDQTVCYDQPKNCGLVNGQAVCVQVPLNADGTPNPIIGPNNSDPLGCVSNSGGKKVCVNSEAKEFTDTDTVTNGDGSTTTTTTKTNNVQGSGTTTTETNTSADGNTTTTTETHEGEGGELGEMLEDSEEGGESTIGTGTCSTLIPPPCEGDAIQCAIAQTVFLADCRQQNIENGALDVGVIEANIKGSDGEIDLTGESNVIGLSGLDTSKFAITSSCPAPLSLTVMGANFTIDFTPFCTLASIFGVLIMLTASVVSLRILSS